MSFRVYIFNFLGGCVLLNIVKYNSGFICFKTNSSFGSFGKDLIGKKNHFKCDAISDTVVLTPDYNIYPCIFLAKPGYEIGRYENGEILLNVEPNIEFNSCIAEDFCNMKIKSLKIK